MNDVQVSKVRRVWVRKAPIWWRRRGGVDTFAPGPLTLNGNEVLAIQFGPTQLGSAPAPAVLVVGTIHANEWFSTAIAQEWMRRLAAAIRDPGSEPELASSLETAAVVVVPVANPDGYMYTRTTNRDHRGNLNVVTPTGEFCTSGVDLNRNFPVAFDETVVPTCAFSTYPGLSAGSEPETQNIMALMSGAVFSSEVGATDVVAVVDYHSFNGDVRVTNGYKAANDANGPQCLADPANSFCANAEYPLYSTVFGDAAAPAWDDAISGIRIPFEHSWAHQSHVGGTLRLYATYRPDGPQALSLLVELPSVRGFNAECATDDAIRSVANAQILALSRATAQAPQLRAARTGTSAFPPMGQAVREWSDASAGLPGEEQSRMGWLHSVPSVVSPPFFLSIDGEATVELERWREGAFFDVYAYRPSVHGRDPMDWPCCFRVHDGQEVEDDTICSTVCSGERVNLCDPGRVQHSGWALVDTTRGGARDCFFTPTAPTGELVIPSGPLAALGPGDEWKACYAHFSLDADDAIPRLGLSFEREALGLEGTGSGSFEVMQEVSFEASGSLLIGGSLTPSMLSFTYPVALSPLPHAAGFRIRSSDLPPELFDGGLRISDLVVTCVAR